MDRLLRCRLIAAASLLVASPVLAHHEALVATHPSDGLVAWLLLGATLMLTLQLRRTRSSSRPGGGDVDAGFARNDGERG